MGPTPLVRDPAQPGRANGKRAQLSARLGAARRGRGHGGAGHRACGHGHEQARPSERTAAAVAGKLALSTRTVQLRSNGCTGMTESTTRKSLDNLPVAGEASGRVDGDGASTTTRTRGSEEKHEWERGISGDKVRQQNQGNIYTPLGALG